MNRHEARSVLGCLLAWFPGRALPPETVEAWSTALVGFDFGDGLAAANALGQRSRFRPSCAELLEACDEARRERLASMPARPLPAPGQAAADVRRALLRVVTTGTLPADDPDWDFDALYADAPAGAVGWGADQHRTFDRLAVDVTHDAANGRGGKGDA